MNIGELLMEHDIKPSIQRIKILEYLMNAHHHPSVDVIYNDLITAIPTLSKTTVYNTLKLFVNKKLINEIVIEGNENRYDAIKTPHGHFKCVDCGKIYDFDFDINNFNIEQLKDFDISLVQFYIKGNCKKCGKG